MLVAEKSLNRIINSKLTFVFFVLSIIIVILVAIFTNGFVKNVIYNYINELTLDSVYSSLELFDGTIITLESSYDKLLTNLILKLGNDIENQQPISELAPAEISTSLNKILYDLGSELQLLGIAEYLYYSVYYYVITPGGKVLRTNRYGYYEVNVNLSQELKELDKGKVLLNRLSYDSITGKPRKDAYLGLSGGYLLKISIPFDTDVFNKLTTQLEELKNKNIFIKDIGIYKDLYTSISGNRRKLTDTDREYFRQISDDQCYLSTDNRGFSSTYYLKWTPERYGYVEIVNPYYIKIQLDFAQHLSSLSRIISVSISGILFLAFLIIYLINKKISRRITEPFVELARSMTQLGNKDLTVIDEDLERTDIKEVNMLLASYQEMTSELSSTFEELKAINEELEASYEESYNLAENLNNIIKVATKLTDTVFEDTEKFLIELFYVAMRLIPEADYGSVYVVEDGVIKYIEAVGHDLEKIQQVPITVNYLNEQEVVNYIEDIDTEDYDKKDEELREKILASKKPIKSTLTIQLYVGEELAGGLCYDIARDSDQKFSSHSIETLRAFGNLASAFLTMQRYKNIHERFQRQIILSIIGILEIHDPYTKGHSENVANISVMIAREMGFSNEELKEIEWAGLVHDIGKILIGKRVLNKPGVLTVIEYEEIKKHPVWGYEVLVNSEELSNIALYVRHHHERWDGEGYPDNLKGEEIPLFSRIIALADSWDTMMSNRVYRAKLPREEAIKELEINKGSQFDPEVVDVALKLIKEGKL